MHAAVTENKGDQVHASAGRCDMSRATDSWQKQHLRSSPAHSAGAHLQQERAVAFVALESVHQELQSYITAAPAAASAGVAALILPHGHICSSRAVLQ
jgi:hypothetical protein